MFVKFFMHHLYIIPFLLLMVSPTISTAQSTKGILERSAVAGTRPVLLKSQIDSLLPERGSFTFPAPYNTQAVRLTNASDCGGADCIHDIGYSYWRNSNSHSGQDSMLIIIGMEKTRGGTGPNLLRYNKHSSELTQLGPVFAEDDANSWASGEGFYFSASQAHSLYVFSGSMLQRYDVITKTYETVVNVSDHLGSGYTVWQTHSSDDDRVHSATVRSSSSYEMLGCMTYREDSAQFNYFPKKGEYDECQIDRSGDWLLIKENIDGRDGEDNRIIGLRTGEERVIYDQEGAGGHSDMGHGYMIALDNWSKNANSIKVWDFNQNPLQGVEVYSNSDWKVEAPAHISHTNSRAGVAPQQQTACGSSSNNTNSAHANEIICFRLDGSGETLVVAPVMTHKANGSHNDYVSSPKGNLDITGEYFIWTSNAGGSRLDAFMVKVPPMSSAGQSVSGPSVNGRPALPGPVLATNSVATGEVNWTSQINVRSVGSALYKLETCDGCADAAALSQQQLAGDGYFEFTAGDSYPMLVAGLSSVDAGTDANSIEFALVLQGGIASVTHWGEYRADTPFASGDVFRISVQGNTVTYSRNGIAFYSSGEVSANSRRAALILLSTGSGITQSRLVTAARAPSFPVAGTANARPPSYVAAVTPGNLPELVTSTASGIPTTARIAGAISTNHGLSFTDSLIVPGHISVNVLINPDLSHWLQPANILMVLRNVEEDIYYGIDASGALSAFNPQDRNPVVFQHLPMLLPDYPLELFNGMVDDSRRGLFEIFVGYQLLGGNEVYFNAQAMILRLE